MDINEIFEDGEDIQEQNKPSLEDIKKIAPIYPVAPSNHLYPPTPVRNPSPPKPTPSRIGAADGRHPLPHFTLTTTKMRKKEIIIIFMIHIILL